MKKKRVLIYVNGPVGPNIGGPRGYLYNLQAALGLEINEDLDVVLYENMIGVKMPRKGFVAERLKKVKFFKKMQSLVNYLKNRLNSLIAAPGCFNDDVEPGEKLAALLKDVDLVHVHELNDVGRFFQWRSMKLWNGKIIVTSHSPEAPSIEMADVMRSAGYSSNYVERYLKIAMKRDIDMIQKADAFVFPSKKAMDPYIDTIDGFLSLLESKPVKFVGTGIHFTNVEKSDIASLRYAPSSDIQICFIGRHNSVKGYDLLIKSLIPILEKNENVWVVCAGLGTIKPPVHKRWIELGHSNKAKALMQASDFLLLPNRRTYYDLILLEALSQGVPVLAAKNGGTIDVAEIANSISMLNFNDDDISQKIWSEINNRADYKEKALGVQRNFNENFGLKKFAADYRSAILSIN